MRAAVLLLAATCVGCTAATDDFRSCAVESVPEPVSNICATRVQVALGACLDESLRESCGAPCAAEVRAADGLSPECRDCVDVVFLELLRACSVNATESDEGVDFECRACLLDEPTNCVNRACEDLYLDSICCFNSCEDAEDPMCERCADTFAAYEACATAPDVQQRCNGALSRCFVER